MQTQVSATLSCTGMCYGLAVAQWLPDPTGAIPLFGVMGAGAGTLLGRWLEQRQVIEIERWRAALTALILAFDGYRRRPSIRRVTLLRETVERFLLAEQALRRQGIAPPDGHLHPRLQILLASIRSCQPPARPALEAKRTPRITRHPPSWPNEPRPPRIRIA